MSIPTRSLTRASDPLLSSFLATKDINPVPTIPWESFSEDEPNLQELHDQVVKRAWEGIASGRSSLRLSEESRPCERVSTGQWVGLRIVEQARPRQ